MHSSFSSKRIQLIKLINSKAYILRQISNPVKPGHVMSLSGASMGSSLVVKTTCLWHFMCILVCSWIRTVIAKGMELFCEDWNFYLFITVSSVYFVVLYIFLRTWFKYYVNEQPQICRSNWENIHVIFRPFFPASIISQGASTYGLLCIMYSHFSLSWIPRDLANQFELPVIRVKQTVKSCRM